MEEADGALTKKDFINTEWFTENIDSLFYTTDTIKIIQYSNIVDDHGGNTLGLEGASDTPPGGMKTGIPPVPTSKVRLYSCGSMSWLINQT